MDSENVRTGWYSQFCFLSSTYECSSSPIDQDIDPASMTHKPLIPDHRDEAVIRRSWPLERIQPAFRYRIRVTQADWRGCAGSKKKRHADNDS